MIKNSCWCNKSVVSTFFDGHLSSLAPNIFVFLYFSQIIEELRFTFCFFVCSSVPSRRRHFLLKICPIQLTFLSRYCLEAPSLSNEITLIFGYCVVAFKHSLKVEDSATLLWSVICIIRVVVELKLLLFLSKCLPNELLSASFIIFSLLIRIYDTTYIGSWLLNWYYRVSIQVSFMRKDKDWNVKK